MEGAREKFEETRDKFFEEKVTFSISNVVQSFLSFEGGVEVKQMPHPGKTRYQYIPTPTTITPRPDLADPNSGLLHIDRLSYGGPMMTMHQPVSQRLVPHPAIKKNKTPYPYRYTKGDMVDKPTFHHK